MEWLYKRIKQYEPLFEKGGKLETFYPIYEAALTIHFSPTDTTKKGAHVRDGLDTKRFMILVVIALTPCVVFGMFNAGYQALLATGASPGIIESMIKGVIIFMPILLTSYAVGGFWEVLFAVIRKHEINEGFLVTGMLFPLTLPPTIPLWQVALGISFGVVVGKEVFGGTGKNFLNPALTGRAFLYFAYPAAISGNAVWVGADGYTQATALGIGAESGMGAVRESVSFMDSFLGIIPGSMGETSALACFIGATILIATGIGSWRIIVSMALSTFIFAELLHMIGSDTNPMFEMNGLWHMVVGGFAFGCVFMATDPVSSSMTERGRWFYGALIGVMTVLIRVINPAFPEGVMLAILFGNVFAPVIDYVVVNANIKRRLARSVVSS